MTEFEIYVWPNKDWCYLGELDSYSVGKSDDFILISDISEDGEPTDDQLDKYVSYLREYS